MQAQELEARDPLHTVPIDVYGLRVRSVSPEVYYYFFGGFLVLRTRLLLLHHDDSFSTSSLYADSSPPMMSPTTVVSSANFPMELFGWMGVQS